MNDPNLLNKKSELVITCHQQSKLLLKSFKKNQYSERSDTMDWYLGLILVVLYLMCQYVTAHPATYWHIQHFRIALFFFLFFFLVSATSFSESFKVFYSQIIGLSARETESILTMIIEEDVEGVSLFPTYWGWYIQHWR